MKNRTLIVAALVMVLLCVGLIFLGLRHENAGGGSPGQSQTTDGQTQETTVTDVSYVPMLVLNRGTGVQDQYLILDVNALIAAHDSGDTSVATDAVYSKLEYALNGCHTILGADYDKAGTPPQTTSA